MTSKSRSKSVAKVKGRRRQAPMKLYNHNENDGPNGVSAFAVNTANGTLLILTLKKPPRSDRWLRLNMKFAPEQPGASVIPPAGPSNVTVVMPDVALPNEFTIAPRGVRRELVKIGKCIYCGAAGLPLGEEHFVPEGLGSRLVLLEASCARCAEKTGNIERTILQASLSPAREHLHIRRKKKKRPERKFPVHVTGPGAKDIISHTSLDEHPSVLFLPYFNQPGLMIDRPIGEDGLQGAFLMTLTALPKPAFPEFASPALDTAAFCQFIAKIAHGFAVLTFGIDGFTPLLPKIILNDYRGDNSLSWYHLVGGNPSQFAPAEAQHVLGSGFFQKDGNEYLIIWLRLLANTGAPVYFAVAGTLTPEQSAKAHALAVGGGDTLNSAWSRSL